MLLNKSIAGLLGVFALGCTPTHVKTTTICPIQQDQPLKFVDIFDGSPEEMAILVPDEATEFHGFWSLEYVYDANRVVTVRCKYSDGKTLDVKLEDKIKQCDYTIDTHQTLTLSCI